MLRVLRDKFLRLGRDEEGVAMVTTLAVFMFMYLVCMGVYAIGTSVKTRIHLQNACDAAAYSAAVVQADTLSRIATINRAMSWTYVQMTRRQMDYIANRWLRHTVSHYRQDGAAALAWWLTSVPPPCPIHGGWGISDISLNGSHTVSDGQISSACDAFPAHLAGQRDSFYAASATVDGLERQIRQDKRAIGEMNDAIDDLMSRLPVREDAAIEGVLKANLSVADDGSTGLVLSQCRYFTERSRNPQSDFSAELRNREDDEARFLWLGGYWGGGMNLRTTSERLGYFAKSRPENVFEDGVDTWMRRGNELLDDTSLHEGIRRSYKRFEKNHKLYSTWTWWSTKSLCTLTEAGWVHVPPGVPLSTCAHIAPPTCLLDDHCIVERVGMRGSMAQTVMRAKVHANIVALWTDEYVGAECHPVVLTQNYFKKPGTLTVGLAYHNGNPWTSILNAITGGIFSAFNPYVEWTVCFSSAKAGYKFVGEDMDNEKRAYRVDWKDGAWNTQNQSWNLCQSDWDAVLIPVRRAESYAHNENWVDGNMVHLGTYVSGNWQSLGGSVPALNPGSDFKAGGSKNIDAFLTGRDYGYEAGFWVGADLPENYDDSPVQQARWQIGRPNQNVNWSDLQKVMFH